jgi:hypothetical protein
MDVSFGMDANVFDYIGECIMGFGGSILKLTTNTGTISLLTQPGLTGFDYQNIKSIKIKALCMVSCPEFTFIGSNPYLCELCADHMPNCVNCLSSNQCT